MRMARKLTTARSRRPVKLILTTFTAAAAMCAPIFRCEDAIEPSAVRRDDRLEAPLRRTLPAQRGIGTGAIVRWTNRPEVAGSQPAVPVG